MRMRGTQGKRGRVTVDKSGLGAKVKKKNKKEGAKGETFDARARVHTSQSLRPRRRRTWRARRSLPPG